MKTWSKQLGYLPTAFALSAIVQSGEVSLYHWPPVWLVWNQLYDNWQFLFLFIKQANPNQSNRRSTVHWYFPRQCSLVQCTLFLLFDWFGISFMTTDIFCFYLQNRQIQTSQAGGQWYNDTFLFSIPWFNVVYFLLFD